MQLGHFEGLLLDLLARVTKCLVQVAIHLDKMVAFPVESSALLGCSDPLVVEANLKQIWHRLHFIFLRLVQGQVDELRLL